MGEAKTSSSFFATDRQTGSLNTFQRGKDAAQENRSPPAAGFKLLDGGLSQLQQENLYICWRLRVGLGAAAAPKSRALGPAH